MPRYNYICNTCKANAEVIKGSLLTDEELFDEIVFETSHAMNPSTEELAAARECPRCDGVDTTLTYMGVSISSYIRGYGYLDRVGCQRDMNLRKLTDIDEDTGLSTDPYAEMRSIGEVDELKAKLKRGGQHDRKPVHVPLTSGAQDVGLNAAVREALSSGLIE